MARRPQQSQSTPLTDAELRATPMPVSGIFWPAAQPVSGVFWQTTQPVSLATAPTTPVTGTFWQATQPVSISGIVAVKAETAHGKQLTFVVVNQSIAGTTVLAAAVTGKKHKILGAVLTSSLLGTVKFTDDAGDLIGPMDVAASQPFVLPTSVVPYQETAATNRALNLVSTVGAVRGVVILVTEP